MTREEAIEYINFSVKEGYMTTEEAEDLFALPEVELIDRVSEMEGIGDYYVNDYEN